MRLRVLVPALSMLAAACAPAVSSDVDAGTSAAFIAVQHDFAGFRTWPRTSLGSDPISGHPAGPRFGYVHAVYETDSTGTRHYASGTIIVKTVEANDVAQYWDIFAMVRRGGNFNAGGAAGWEFFKLQIGADGTPAIASRGTDATMAGDVYAGGQNVGGCNSCHGEPARETDGILSGLLLP